MSEKRMSSQSIRPEQIAGTWRLIAAQAVDVDGRSLPSPYGPVPMGRLVFTPTGRMMAVICDGRTTMPEGETRGYASYCGNFRIVEDNVLITRVDAALVKERIGGEQRRRIELRGDQLVLIPPRRSNGEQRELVWTLDGPA
jgi:Lipocalin-like domain